MMLAMALNLSLLPRPPRRVRGFISGGGNVWFARIFVMPHTLIGFGATAIWMFLVFWTLFGTDLKGVIIGTDTSYSSKHGTTYKVRYRYVVRGQSKSGWASVSRADYDRFKVHDDPSPEVKVRYFSLGPWEHAELRIGPYKVWASAAFFTIWIAFWDSIVGVFVYMLWIKPLRVRQLYKHGLATSGILTGKRVQRGRSTSYYLAYAFNDPATGREYKAETRVWKHGDWDKALEGQQVIVLYAPENPKHSTVYEFGGYDLADG